MRDINTYRGLLYGFTYQQNTFKPRYHVDQANTTAASYMTQNYMTLPEHISVAEAKKVFLEKLEENGITNQIFITTNEILIGISSAKSLLKHSTDSDIAKRLYFDYTN